MSIQHCFQKQRDRQKNNPQAAMEKRHKEEEKKFLDQRIKRGFLTGFSDTPPARVVAANEHVQSDNDHTVFTFAPVQTSKENASIGSLFSRSKVWLRAKKQGAVVSLQNLAKKLNQGTTGRRTILASSVLLGRPWKQGVDNKKESTSTMSVNVARTTCVLSRVLPPAQTVQTTIAPTPTSRGQGITCTGAKEIYAAHCEEEAKRDFEMQHRKPPCGGNMYSTVYKALYEPRKYPINGTNGTNGDTNGDTNTTSNGNMNTTSNENNDTNTDTNTAPTTQIMNLEKELTFVLSSVEERSQRQSSADLADIADLEAEIQLLKTTTSAKRIECLLRLEQALLVKQEEERRIYFRREANSAEPDEQNRHQLDILKQQITKFHNERINLEIEAKYISFGNYFRDAPPTTLQGKQGQWQSCPFVYDVIQGKDEYVTGSERGHTFAGNFEDSKYYRQVKEPERKWFITVVDITLLLVFMCTYT